ncbi:MAG: hypothetical protein M1815_001221 [Lichina confinis]|nr:MAG: hypothetical protein M1815_001221 [Lichina confinis]
MRLFSCISLGVVVVGLELVAAIPSNLSGYRDKPVRDHQDKCGKDRKLRCYYGWGYGGKRS